MPDATALSVSAPTTVTALEARRFKGEPRRLAWSPDGREIYVQFVEHDKRGNPSKATHVVVRIEGAKTDTVAQEPAWAAKYWAWKSAQISPMSPTFRIAAESKEEVVRATGTPMGGDLARGSPDANPGGGVGVGEVTNVTNQSQKVTTWTLRLKGEVIGQWTNQAVVPGLTFGWTNKRALIAFSDRDGDLIVMDESSRKKKVDGLDDTRLPAWDEDGSRIATLVEDGRKGWKLTLVDVK
jgi:hypothetical protein